MCVCMCVYICRVLQSGICDTTHQVICGGSPADLGSGKVCKTRLNERCFYADSWMNLWRTGVKILIPSSFASSVLMIEHNWTVLSLFLWSCFLCSNRLIPIPSKIAPKQPPIWLWINFGLSYEGYLILYGPYTPHFRMLKPPGTMSQVNLSRCKAPFVGVRAPITTIETRTWANNMRHFGEVASLYHFN